MSSRDHVAPKRHLRRSWFRGIRVRLAIWFSVAFVAVAVPIELADIMGIPFTSYGGRLGERKAATLRGLELIADLKKERISRWLKDRRDDVRVSAANDMVERTVVELLEAADRLATTAPSDEQRWSLLRKEKTFEQLQRHLNAVKQTHGAGVYADIHIVGADTGTVLVSTNENVIGEGYSDQSHFHSALRMDEPWVSPLRRSAGSPRPVFHVSHAIHNHEFDPATLEDRAGRPIALLVAEVDVNHIVKPALHTGEGLGESGEALLVNRDGLILTPLKHPLPDGSMPKPLEYEIATEPAALAAAGNEGVIDSVDYRGEGVLAAYRHIEVAPDWGWGLVVKTDKAELFAPLWKDFAHTIVLGLLGIVVFVVLAAILAENLMRPLRALSRTAEKVAAGDLSARSPVSTFDEVGLLAKMLNAMIDHVEHWHTQLSDQVQQHTAGLRETNEKLITEIAERKRAERTLQQSQRELAVRKQIADAFLAVPDDEMYAEVLNVVLDAMDSEYGVFGYVDQNGALVAPSMTRHVWDQCRIPGKTIVFPRETWGESSWPRAIREKKTLYSNEPSTLAPQGHVPIRRNITLPIIHRDEVIGLLQVANKETDYDEQDVRLLERIGHAIAPILYARLTRDREERRRRQAQEALRESEQRFDLAVSGSNDGLWDWPDVNKDQQWWSPRWYTLLGYRDGEVAASRTKFREWLHPDDLDRVEDAIHNHFRRCEPFDMEFRLRTKSAMYRWFRGRAQALWDEEGTPLRMSGSIQDITELTQTREERERVIEELESKNAELERFAYTVSHDLKSPLITIKGYLGLLKKDIGGGDARTVEEDLSIMNHAADRMEQLLGDLLELSRIGRLVNPPQEVPLGELARESVELVGGQIHSRGVKIEIPSDLPVVFGDRPRLLEVMQNLVDNAVKYMGDQAQPRIEIGARSVGEETVCYVRDNGMGIDPRYHEKVFGLFEKLDNQVEGSGVGLALVKRIVEVHGGRIWVESEGTGQGSTFCFTIPHSTPSRR